jgi:hypothetical protein
MSPNPENIQTFDIEKMQAAALSCVALDAVLVGLLVV